ncbi:hypothetical protein I230019B6_25870 [Firmicutes bacterium i23-0019-B6]
MLYVQGAIWGRGLAAFFKKAANPRPQMAPARFSKNENKSD